MTTHTTSATDATKDDQPDVKSDTATEPPIASKTQPGLGVAHTTPETDLESRIKARRTELLGKLGELRTNARLEANRAADKLRAQLSELAHIIKEGVVDGWTSLGDTAKRKLEHWLAESVRPPTQNGPAKSGQS